jgi:hypothetical protein
MGNNNSEAKQLKVENIKNGKSSYQGDELNPIKIAVTN